jgi:hypothetical protein
MCIAAKRFVQEKLQTQYSVLRHREAETGNKLCENRVVKSGLPVAQILAQRWLLIGL